MKLKNKLSVNNVSRARIHFVSKTLQAYDICETRTDQMAADFRRI